MIRGLIFRKPNRILFSVSPSPLSGLLLGKLEDSHGWLKISRPLIGSHIRVGRGNDVAPWEYSPSRFLFYLLLIVLLPHWFLKRKKKFHFLKQKTISTYL